MAELVLHGRPVPTVFDLLGHDENDMTYALGWGLAQSRPLLEAFAARVAPGITLTQPLVLLQQHDPLGRGYTDIEILSSELHAIVEAKRGWWIPSAGQLRRYEARLAAEKRDVQRIVVLMQIGAEEIVRHYLADWQPEPPATSHVLGWSDVLRLAQGASRKGGLRERHLVYRAQPLSSRRGRHARHQLKQRLLRFAERWRLGRAHLHQSSRSGVTGSDATPDVTKPRTDLGLQLLSGAADRP